MAKQSRKWFYNSKQWRAVRQQALIRDGFTCALCGARATEVHHAITLDDENVLNPDIALNVDLLQCLCHECHTSITQREMRKSPDCGKEFYFDSEGKLQRVPPVVKK